MSSGMLVDLPVAGRPVLVVGGGPQALGRIAALRGADAQVTVAATAVADAVADLADRGLLSWVRRPVTDDDIARAWLVVAATGDVLADAEVARRAAEAGRFCLSGTGSGPDGGSAARDPVGGSGRVAGRVVLVGGGPGDPGLITVAGAQAVRDADVVICDRLAPIAVLDTVGPDTEIIDVSKIPRGNTTPQAEINRLLIDRATAGRTVVRLKGGDSFVFGRGGEEWQACVAAGIAVQIIPGVSSAIAAPALAGIPATHRSLNQGFTVITGHLPPGHVGSTLDWNALAHSGTALIVMMGVATLGAIADALIAAGMRPDTPAATVADGGLPSQRSVRAPLERIAAAGAAAGLRAPAITVIGSVAAFEPTDPIADI